MSENLLTQFQLPQTLEKILVYRFCQVNASWIYWIFETGPFFDNIFETVDLTENFHSGIIWMYIEIIHNNKSAANLDFC